MFSTVLIVGVSLWVAAGALGTMIDKLVLDQLEPNGEKCDWACVVGAIAFGPVLLVTVLKNLGHYLSRISAASTEKARKADPP